MIYIGLGSNLGNRKRYLMQARKRISEIKGVEIKRTSNEIYTAPYGNTEQPEFLNQVIEISTSLEPEELMKKFFEIEKESGRIRKQKWDVRTLDIDILLWGNEVINTEMLQVPHPDLHNRIFVLESLMELIPDKKHPVIKKTFRDIYNQRSLKK